MGEQRYVIMDGSKEIAEISAGCARSLHKKLVEILAHEYMKMSNVKVVRCT